MHLQVLYSRVVIADVTAEGVIDSSHCPINLRQVLFYPVQCPRCFPESQKTSNDLSDHTIMLQSSPGEPNEHLIRVSWLRSHEEARVTSEVKPDMFQSVELLREDSLLSSCTR